MMRVSVHQPNFAPWLGFFNKAASVDTFVLLDHVQYTRNGYQNRCKIKTSSGAQWLTIPVLTKGRFGQSTLDVEIDNSSNWQKKIWDTVYYAYKKAPCFSEYGDQFRRLISSPWDKLVSVNEAILDWLFQELTIRTRIVRSSELGVKGAGSDLILGICRALGASEYLSGPSGKDYLDLDDFVSAGVKVTFQEFHHPRYPQLYGDFVSGLSVLDGLFNMGGDIRDLIL